MPRGNVRDFMRQQPREFSLAVQLAQQPLVDIKKTARQCKSIELGRINHLDGECDLGVGVANNSLGHAAHVFDDVRVGDKLRLPVNGLGDLLSERSLFLQRLEVHTFSGVPLTDPVHVVFFGIRWFGFGSRFELHDRMLGICNVRRGNSRA